MEVGAEEEDMLSESIVPSVAVAGLATDGTNQMARRTATDGTIGPVDASTFVDGMQLVSIIALPIRQGVRVRGVEKNISSLGK